jgi:hypothetical protein
MKDIPNKFAKLYNKAKKSRKAAIRSFCVVCMGYSVEEVSKCTDTTCPLFSWRIKG